MPETAAKKKTAHRKLDRYPCPPFFTARICSGETVEERASVENLSLRGLSVKTSCRFEEGGVAEVELGSNYVAPFKIQARVKWVASPESEGSPHVVGFSITRVRILDWLRFMRLISQLKKELW